MKTVMSNFRKWWNGGLSNDKTIMHNGEKQCIAIEFGKCENGM